MHFILSGDAKDVNDRDQRHVLYINWIKVLSHNSDKTVAENVNVVYFVPFNLLKSVIFTF